jgi:acyl-CoA dehydrogenase
MADTSFLDWPWFDESHRTLARSLDEWMSAQCAESSESESDADGATRDWVRRLGEGGWLRYTVPQAYGGVHKKLDVRSLSLAREILTRYDGIADVAFAMQGLGSGPIGLFGSEELKREFLPEVAAGRKIAAFALSEAEAGSDVAAMTTSAERRGDNFVINGAKTWISNGPIADFYSLFARTGEAQGSKGISAFVVDRSAPGLEIMPALQMISPHSISPLKFINCLVDKTRLLGAAGQGFKIAMANLDVFRTTVGAAALGFARRALDEAVARAASRKLFGGVLADLQMTQARLADMAVEVEASALLVYRAAWVKDCRADRVTREAAMAKLYATEAAQHVADGAVQLFGGVGVISGSAVEKLYREVRALRIYEGASEVQKVIIAGQVLSAGGRGR